MRSRASRAVGSQKGLEIEGDARFVAHNPGVMARRGLERLAGPDFDLHTIGSANHHATGDDVTDVGGRDLPCQGSNV